VSYSTFLGKVGSDQVKTVDINDKGAIKGALEDGTKFTTRMPTALDNSRLEQRLESKKAEITASQSRGGSPWGTLLVLFLPLLFIVALFVWSGRRAARTPGGGLSASGRARAKIIEAERPTTRFEDVAGYEGVKQEISEIVDFLRSPERYAVVGAKGPRGVIMVGPPGTGKTLIARAVAGEAEVPFLSATGSAFVEMFVGVGASRVRDLFAEARKRAPRSSSSMRSTPSAAVAAGLPAWAATTNASRPSTSSSPRWTASTSLAASWCRPRPTGPRPSTRLCCARAASTGM
jgi:cell division protease FtsH